MGVVWVDIVYAFEISSSALGFQFGIGKVQLFFLK